MSISLVTTQINGTRRVRLFFSGPLAVGAFNTSLYAAATADGGGPSPISIEAAFAIATDPNAVEIAINCDLTPGGLYTVTCTSVPGTDSSTFTGTANIRAVQPVSPPANVEPETSDFQLTLYKRDIAWGSQGFIEDSTGDLRTISGRPNWQGAMSRRMISDGVTWDAVYGAKAQQAVDAPAAFQTSLAGQFLAQARLDPRTYQASISLSDNPNDSGGFGFDMEITGRDGLDVV
jgi:hypothetical protein